MSGYAVTISIEVTANEGGYPLSPPLASVKRRTIVSRDVTVADEADADRIGADLADCIHAAIRDVRQQLTELGEATRLRTEPQEASSDATP